MGSLLGGYPPADRDYTGWEYIHVSDLVDKVGWWVEVHGHRYALTAVHERWVDSEHRNGMITMEGGPWGADYCYPGAQVYLYTGHTGRPGRKFGTE